MREKWFDTASAPSVLYWSAFEDKNRVGIARQFNESQLVYDEISS